MEDSSMAHKADRLRDGLSTHRYRAYLYMKLTLGIEASCGNDGEYVLKLRKNIYGQKQARRVTVVAKGSARYPDIQYNLSQMGLNRP
eukprot:8348259-Ditylum_brightwellii.AAC.1